VLTLADIIKITQEYGLQTLGGIFVVGVLYLMAKCHIDIWTFKKKRQIDADYKKYDFDEMIEEILNSEFFRNLKFKISVDIPTEHFSDDSTLDLLYKDLLICLYSSYRNVLKDKISKMDEGDSLDSWVNSFMESIYHTMDDFEKEAKRMGIPDSAIAEFTTWFTPFLHQIYNYVTVIDLSEPECLIRKTKFFLLTLELILVNATAQAQKFDVFEGKFNGKEYRGNVIGGQSSP